MRVSVIIPNYNHAPYLRQRIESVMSQTCQDMEVIILDDSSTDESREIINTYRDHPLVSHIIMDDQNSGSTFIQWQKGLKLAKGDWIWIAESDDYCDAGFLSVLLSPEISDGAGLRFCISQAVDETGTFLYPPVLTISEGTYRGTEFLADRLLESNTIPNASGVLVRKELLQKVLTPDITSYKLAGDWLVWCRLACLTDIHYSHRAINFHRQHKQTVRDAASRTGSYYEEFSKLRKSLSSYLTALPKTAMRESLIRQNQLFDYREEGYRANELIRLRKFRKSLKHLWVATFKPSFNITALKNALYWVVKKPDL